MAPRIRFLRATAGHRLAYATDGVGPTLVLPAWWVSHVERDFADPAFRRFFTRLAERFTVVRYDRLGTGLSDRERTVFTPHLGTAVETVRKEVALWAAHSILEALAGDPEEISRRINDAGTNTLRMISDMRDYVMSVAGEVAHAAFAACGDADLILHSFLFTTGAHSLARQMGIPDISAQLFPMFLPTREFPNVAVPDLPAGPLSYLSHWIANQVFWYGGNGSYKRLRAQYGASLPQSLYWPFKGPPEKWRTLLLGAWSPSVLPRPGDWPASAVEVTGYWYLEASEKYQPPAGLADFLAAGEPPVCVSFGSMIHRRAEQIMQDLMKALSPQDTFWRSPERSTTAPSWSPAAPVPWGTRRSSWPPGPVRPSSPPSAATRRPPWPALRARTTS